MHNLKPVIANRSRRKKLALFFLQIVFLISIAKGQNQFSLPQILPASPEPSAFMNSNIGNVNLSTGAATAKIPLYDIKVNNFTFPISLAYSTTGLKADEASSNVGLGWVLNATGMITRSVKGAPDEFSQRLAIPASFTTNTDEAYYYSMNASNPQSGYDGQPDEFQFSFNGYSGKFILDNNYVPRVTSTSNLKITVQITVTPGSTAGNIGLINITTPDGIKYQFGNAYEKTVSHNINAFNWYQNVTKTAFFLDRIDLPTGEYILFNYASINNRAVTGQTQELRIGAPTTNTITCTSCTEYTQYTAQEDQVYYNSKYLTGISTSTGLAIALNYEARPDLSYGNRLKGLTINGLKKYTFSYYDVAGSSSKVTGRFFLTKLQDVNLNTNSGVDSSHNYLFQYNGMTQVPLPISVKQDYLGYYSGGYNGNTDLIPPALNANGGTSMDFSYRNPSSDNAKLGTLSNIQYPTGGEEQFIYEGNTQIQSIRRNTFTSVSLAGRGSATFTSANFTVPTNQSVSVSTYAADAILNDGYTAPATAHTVWMWIYEGSTMIASRSSLGYTVDNTTVSLYAGHTYRLVMQVWNSTEIGYCTLTYDYSPTPIYDTSNVIFPGVRIKQILTIDPLTLSVHSKYYTYASLDKMNFSSGQCPAVTFVSYLPIRKYCGAYIGQFSNDCSVTVYSSSSTGNIYNYAGSGSVFYYKTVIESDDPNFVNGGTEYTFFDNDNGLNKDVLLGTNIPNLTAGQYPTLSGVVYKNRKFNSNKEIIQEDINEYETLIDLSNSVSSYYVRKRYDAAITLPDRMDAFDVSKSLYGNYWNRIKTNTSKIYTQGLSLIHQTTYSYGSSVNISPSTVATSDSKKRTTLIEKKYPTDFAGTAVYDIMISRNIIEPVIQQMTYKDGSLLLTTLTNYFLWDNNIVSPITIQQQKAGGNLENFIQFNKYGSNGNIAEQQKTNDVKEVYLWGYNNVYPVAKITGSSYATVIQNITQSQIDAAGFDDASLRNVLNSLRANLPTAIVETYTYKPFVGATSKTDASGHTTYFEYDGFNRLKLMRDQNGNIIKDYSYNYTDASNGNAVIPFYSSSYQIGQFQKNNCSTGLTGSIVSYVVPDSKYYSIVSLTDADNKAINDKNTNGQAYANLNGTCSSCSNCSGPSNRCINTVCEAGLKVYTASAYDSIHGYYVCTYHYEWSDGNWSPDYTETSNSICVMGI